MNDESKRGYFQNWISVAGGIASVCLFAIILFLVVVTFLDHEVNPYVSLITYLILPGFLTVGLVMIPLGAVLERKRRLKQVKVHRFPQIDFNNPRHQRWAFAGIGITTLFILFSTFGAYRAYHFTESPVFCGKLCHKVMEPEHTAYQNSPHARVDCVQCHIGPGADWYVRSKISGLYQIYSVFANRFSRPIKTPIKNLRPAQETCEQCHWPQQFYGAVEQDRHYFLPDEANSEWQTRMLMFVGGGSPPRGKAQGIHWHMNIKNKVYYIATDEKKQVIPWVKKIGLDGKEEIFTAGKEYSADNPPKGEPHRMDCMDCHNRPSHIFKSPVEAVDEAMSIDTIDRSLPYVKREAVKALLGKYASHEEAAKGIESHFKNFYGRKYPQLMTEKAKELNQAIRTVSEIYHLNFFPKMNVSWKGYPDNIGHLNSPGCFRCHDGEHKSAEGNVINNSCNACHSIISQGSPPALESSADGLEFKHPDEDIGDEWKDTKCFECHTGELV